MKTMLTFDHVHVCSLAAGHKWHFKIISACHDLISQYKENNGSADQCRSDRSFCLRHQVHLPGEYNHNFSLLQNGDKKASLIKPQQCEETLKLKYQSHYTSI